MGEIVRRIMKILFLYGDEDHEWNCSEHRVAIPFRAMRRAGIRCEYAKISIWENTPPEHDRATKEADLIFLQRNAFANAINKITYCRSVGIPIVVDLDDGYHFMGLDTGSPNSEFWQLGKVMVEGKPAILDPHPLRALEYGVKIAGAMSSPSKVIMGDWEKFGVRTYFVPNLIESRLYMRYDVYREPGVIYIGGGGSMSHLKSWTDSGVAKALDILVREYQNIKVVITGDSRVYTKIKSLPQSRRIPLGWANYSVYSKNLSLFDIGVIPLSGEYDRRRSWIKPVEYSAMGIPWVGSNYEPNVIEDGTGTLVENTIEAWYNALKDKIEHLSEEKAFARGKVNEVINSYDVDINNKVLIDVYSKMIGDVI